MPGVRTSMYLFLGTQLSSGQWSKYKQHDLESLTPSARYVVVSGQEKKVGSRGAERMPALPVMFYFLGKINTNLELVFANTCSFTLCTLLYFDFF